MRANVSVSSSVARLEKPLVTEFKDDTISGFLESKLVTNVSSGTGLIQTFY